MEFEFQGLTPLIQVFDMPASVAFYRDVLGFEIAMQSRPGEHFDWAWLRKGTASLMLNTAYEADQRPARPDPARIAGHGDTGLFFDCADLDSAYEYLRSRGVAAKKPETRVYGMRQMYVTDPDGYELCFQHPVK
jgi:catechol 2,3-dioxygenase-like lactoylglutathione lyase family enzyme